MVITLFILLKFNFIDLIINSKQIYFLLNFIYVIVIVKIIMVKVNEDFLKFFFNYVSRLNFTKYFIVLVIINVIMCFIKY